MSDHAARAAIVRRFVDQPPMARAQPSRCSRIVEQGAAFLEMLIGGDATRRGSSPPASVTGKVSTSLRRARRAPRQDLGRRGRKPAEIEAAREKLAAALKGFVDLVAEIADVSKSGNVLYEINPRSS